MASEWAANSRFAIRSHRSHAEIHIATPRPRFTIRTRGTRHPNEPGLDTNETFP